MSTELRGSPVQRKFAEHTVGFLLSRYPAISHTFFLKEVLGLRERGMIISVASINPPDREKSELPMVEAAEADQTFYVKSGGALLLLAAVLRVAMTNPVVALRGIGAALHLGGWDLKSRAFSLFYLAEALLVGDWMRRKSLQHLHVHFGGPVATVGLLTAQAWQIPWSITLHGPDEFFDQEASYLKQKIDSAKFVVCISDFCRSQVMRIAAERDEQALEIVRLGVDCRELQPVTIGVNEANSDFVSNTEEAAAPIQFVCTGRMVAAKGHRILIQAIAGLVSGGVNLTCTLIGDGPERSQLLAMCDRLGISDKVHFTGALAHGETLSIVSTADVFVLASFAEGLPVALMEAMAMGIPCVSTTIAAIPELIHDGKNGLLVAPANVEALRGALGRLASDPELRQRLGRNARLTVEAEYNLDQNLDRLAAMWSRRLATQ